MSIERAIQRNKERLGVREEFHKRILPPNEEQRAVTEKWILPYEELILEDVRALRKEADKKLPKSPVIRARTRDQGDRYPIGFCKQIRNEVLDRMKSEMLNTDYQGLQMVKNFVREGGVIQPFWGIDSEKYFQNAIQMGDSILDVANDTVDPKKEPVMFYPSVAEAPLKRMENYTEFADIAEKYWGRDLYPNIYLPHLAPLFPILSIEPPRRMPDMDGKVRDYPQMLYLEDGVADLMHKNLYTQQDGHLFGLSSDFMFHSPYAAKRLPEDILESLLHGPLIKRAQKLRSDVYHVTTDPDEALAEMARFSFDGIDTTPVPAEMVDEANKVMRWGMHLDGIVLARGPY